MATVEESVNAKDEPKIGEYVEGKGIFAGIWSPKDREGNSLNRTFNLYAARQDLGALKTFSKTVIKTFNKTVKLVAGIKKLDGHNGFNHSVRGKTPDEALYDALRSGTYDGEWFIPTKDALNGLYENKDEGELKGTFITEAVGSNYGHLYWACTEHRDDSSYVWNQRFADGGVVWDRRDVYSLSGRLLRAELRP